MRVKVQEVGVGIHPNERVVTVQTLDGPERLVVHERSVVDGWLEVGYPIREKPDAYLVELPRETMRGLWRVWIRSSLLGALTLPP